MRLQFVLLLSLCSGCNALTGASELEPVGCTRDCTDASSVETSAVDSTARDTTTAPDTATSDETPPMPDTGTLVEETSTGCPPKMARITAGMVSYCIDLYEVTNVEYKAFLDSSVKTAPQPAHCTWNTTFVPSAWPYIDARANFPVRWVDWCDALAYCTYRGKRLCGRIGGGPSPLETYADATVNEWYRACTFGGTRAYPYGNTVNETFCNGKNSGNGIAVNVGSLPNCTTPYGTFDMSGNVSEWEDSCSGTVGATDTCRTRGGSWNSLDTRCVLSEGSPRQAANEMIGIRCCDD